MEKLFHRRATKSFIGTVDGDSVRFRCACDVFPGFPVMVEIPLDLAQALIARRPAREVLRGFPRAVVELFTSGMTEAEFDLAYGRFTKPLADYQLYEVNGTDTAEIKAVNPAMADTQQMLIVG